MFIRNNITQPSSKQLTDVVRVVFVAVVFMTVHKQQQQTTQVNQYQNHSHQGSPR